MTADSIQFSHQLRIQTITAKAGGSIKCFNRWLQLKLPLKPWTSHYYYFISANANKDLDLRTGLTVFKS